jgi:hypothetical protein
MSVVYPVGQKSHCLVVRELIVSLVCSIDLPTAILVPTRAWWWYETFNEQAQARPLVFVGLRFTGLALDILFTNKERTLQMMVFIDGWVVSRRTVLETLSWDILLPMPPLFQEFAMLDGLPLTHLV